MTQRIFKNTVGPTGRPNPSPAMPPVRIIDRESFNRDKKTRIIFATIRNLVSISPEHRAPPRNPIEKLFHDAASAVDELLKMEIR